MSPSLHAPNPTYRPSEAWRHLAELLTQCSRKLRAILAEQVEHRELSEPQWCLLLACRGLASQPPSQSELADLMQISPAHVSGLVEQMRSRGLLAGRRDERDRRRQVWRLTPPGEALVEGLLHDLDAWARAVRPRGEERKLASLIGLLESLAASLDVHRPAHNRTPGDPAPAKGVVA